MQESVYRVGSTEPLVGRVALQMFGGAYSGPERQIMDLLCQLRRRTRIRPATLQCSGAKAA